MLSVGLWELVVVATAVVIAALRTDVSTWWPVRDRSAFFGALGRQLLWLLVWLLVFIGALVAATFAAHSHVQGSDALPGLIIEPCIRAFANQESSGPELSLSYADLGSPFSVSFRIARLVGWLLVSPILFYVVWRLLAPASHRARATGFLFAGIATACFLAGALFAHYLVAPALLEFILRPLHGDITSLAEQPMLFTPRLTVEACLTLEFNALMGCGLIAALLPWPVIIASSSRIATIAYPRLSGLRSWWIVLASLVAALLSPPDLVSQAVLAIPLIALYRASLWTARKRADRTRHHNGP